MTRKPSRAITIEGEGSVSGLIDGGIGGYDGVKFIDPNDDQSEFFNFTGLDQSGTVTKFSKSIQYAGLDHIEVLTFTRRASSSPAAMSRTA